MLSIMNTESQRVEDFSEFVTPGTSDFEDARKPRGKSANDKQVCLKQVLESQFLGYSLCKVTIWRNFENAGHFCCSACEKGSHACQEEDTCMSYHMRRRIHAHACEKGSHACPEFSKSQCPAFNV
jgi:hypothetical protein